MLVFEVFNVLGFFVLKSRTWFIFKIFVIKGEGFDEVMEW